MFERISRAKLMIFCAVMDFFLCLVETEPGFWFWAYWVLAGGCMIQAFLILTGRWDG